MAERDTLVQKASFRTPLGMPNNSDLFCKLIWYRFNRLAWGHVDSTRPRGVIAAGMENGELALWDPTKILANARYAT